MRDRSLTIFIKYLSIAIILTGLFLCSWYVIHGDINFFTDVARDFHLYREIDQKKVVLLGPRSSTSGLFHGPLWMYLNYPAYLIGHGNPVVVGWYWILLIALFLGSNFYVAKKLFDANTAYLSTALLSIQLVFAANALFNPYGALFLLPLFFYFFIRYLRTNRFVYLLIHLFLAGCLIQFEMATGIPFLLLSTLPLVYFIMRRKNFLHLFCFAILLLPLSTFLLFDIRHQFLQFHAVLQYLSAGNHHVSQHGLPYMFSRLKLLISPGMQLFRIDYTGIRNTVVLIVTALFSYAVFKEKKNKLVYASLIYFYIGDYLLMMVNRTGDILFQYYMPLSVLSILFFTSFITLKKYKVLFLIIFLIILTVNIFDALTYIQASDSFIGKNVDSWTSLDAVAKRVYQTSDSSFGYFVYSPDVVAYQEKYAMLYEGTKSAKKAESFVKKPITYLVIAPPPPDKPGMKDDFWKKYQLHLDKKPTSVVTFPNGYKIERYVLSDQETKVPFDPGINPGLFFR